MLHKIIIFMIAGLGVITSSSSASEPNDYIIPGRSLLFNGTVSGLRAAYEVFDNGLNDSNCVECNSNRELIFLHAITRISMWAFRDNGPPVDSAIEFAREFDIELLGDYWQELDINYPDSNYPTNQHNAYVIPKDIPDIINGIVNFIDVSAIPEINAVIDELNLITDAPDDRFRIFFDPNETRMFFGPDTPGLENDVEVDYGDVLVLKGLLMALKAMLQSQSAYDVFIDANDMLIEKVYGDCFNINIDLLLPHPDLLKVLPTVNDSNDGASVLAKVRQDWITSINYYLDAIDYISNENNPPGSDPQEDELLYIDPNDRDIINLVNSRIITIRDSISNDTVGVYPWKTKKTYELQDPCSTTTWALTLNYDIINLPYDEPGSFAASDNNSAPSPWRVTDISRDGNELMLEMEYDVPGYWGGAFFSGTLSGDQNDITNGTFSYWGPDYGTIYNLSGSVVSTEVEEKRIDLNPIFGSSARYPYPVNPRDLLPEFDEWNAAQPGTLGHGLDDDATLGGILPDMTQYDWQKMLDLQPSGLLYLDFISPWQITIDGNINDWNLDQLVFTDIAGDTKNDVNGVDIKKAYLAYDWQNLYGAIELYDNIGSTSSYYEVWYDFILSYSPQNTLSLHTLGFEIGTWRDEEESGYWCSLAYMAGTDSWTYQEDSYSVAVGQKAIEFKIPFSVIPDYLPGRFISIISGGYSEDFDTETTKIDGEENLTHLKIGDIGTISGTVSYNGYKGDPIFVHAYTDPANPEESAVATTMITEPGPYKLTGIGIGWKGFVRAYTPLFGFENPFELGAFQVQSSMPVFLMGDTLDDVDITLNYPVKLQKDVWKSGEIDSVTREVDWYYFDAVAGGTYTIDLARGTAQYACIALYDRDADTELIETYYWQTQQLIWLCQTSGRYYVKVDNGYYQPASGTYQIRMTSDLTCPQADIACAEWVGVRDCKVDFYDFTVLISRWLDRCTQPYWCDEADLDKSGSVDFVDFATLANEWLSNGTP